MKIVVYEILSMYEFDMKFFEPCEYGFPFEQELITDSAFYF